MLAFSSNTAGYVIDCLLASAVVVILLRAFARKLLGLDAGSEPDDQRQERVRTESDGSGSRGGVTGSGGTVMVRPAGDRSGR
jgi:hypothetical protein